MPISSCAGTPMRCSEECIIPDAEQGGREWAAERSEVFPAPSGAAPTCPAGANALYSYPWLIERISQTFFQEWIGAWCVPTKIDHAEWLCTMCGEYTATWETRSGSYCKYCWTLGQRSPLGSVPQYLKELIPHERM